jgi:cell division protein FtsQ
MNGIRTINFRKILMLSLWLLLGIGATVLLAAAVHRRNVQQCTGLEISIKGSDDKNYIDEKLISRILSAYTGNSVKGKAMSSFDLHAIENSLTKDIWIREASIYFDNNGVMQIQVTEREPVVRVFTKNGNSYYVDSSLVIMPLSDLIAARLPVFTGFPSDHRVLSRRDSSLLKDVVKLGMHIQNNPVLMAMVEQIDISPSGEFELIPKIEDQVVQIGNTERLEEKFHDLLLFYQQTWAKGLVGRYNRVSVKFKDQVVASVRGMAEIQADSIKALQMLYQIAYEAEKKANDSVLRIQQDNAKNTVDSSMARQKIQRDETGVDAANVKLITDKSDLSVAAKDKKTTSTAENKKNIKSATDKKSDKKENDKKDDKNKKDNNKTRPKITMPGKH